jgi:phosphopantothenoylcysteine decarboxylase/phosphopantothenate--cysteine ligase
MLAGKNVVLGVTGSIAAYKAADLASKLTQGGALVDVIMTEAATEFIAPLTFRSLTHRSVVTKMFDPDSELAVEHVALARRADIVLIAPATANTMAKLAWGLADDPITTTVLATEAPVLLAPAMDAHMYEAPATQANVAKLKERGYQFVGPEAGRLASGLTGQGRLSSTEQILGSLRWLLGRNGDLAGRRVVVSAGGTQEAIDPVRHIGNRSSGKMGYAVAEAARDRGAQVTLVAAPNSLPDIPHVKMVKVRSALQMKDAVDEAVKGCDVVIMSAAVADYRPASTASQKIKKGEGNLTIDLTRNPDIIGGVNGPFIKIGFAAESQDLLENARKKLQSKNLALVAANDITATDAGFAVDTNRVIIIDRDGGAEHLPLMRKSEVADRLLDRVVKLLEQQEPATLAATPG